MIQPAEVVQNILRRRKQEQYQFPDTLPSPLSAYCYLDVSECLQYVEIHDGCRKHLNVRWQRQVLDFLDEVQVSSCKEQHACFVLGDNKSVTDPGAKRSYAGADEQENERHYLLDGCCFEDVADVEDEEI
jgi:hypothetical protein